MSSSSPVAAAAGNALAASNNLKRFYNECHVPNEAQQVLIRKYNVKDYGTLQVYRDDLLNHQLDGIANEIQENLGRVLAYLDNKMTRRQPKGGDGSEEGKEGCEYDPTSDFTLKKYIDYYLRVTKSLRINDDGGEEKDDDDMSVESSTSSTFTDDSSAYEARMRTIVIKKKPTFPTIVDDDDYDEEETEVFDDGINREKSTSPFMTEQGIESKGYNDGLVLGNGKAGAGKEEITSVVFKKKTFHVGRCYYYNWNDGKKKAELEEVAVEAETDAEMEEAETEKAKTEAEAEVGTKKIVAIQSFTSDRKAAYVVEIKHISKTFLGRHDTHGMLAEALPKHKYVQVVPQEEDSGSSFQKKDPFQLKYFSDAVADDDKDYPATIPSLVYVPQKEGNRRNFAYYYDRRQYGTITDDQQPDSTKASKSNSCGRYNYARPRDGMRVLDLFSGAGGMHIGYKREGFETAAAVELNETAVKTFVHNNKADKGVVYNGDVRDFFEDCKNNEDGMQDKVGRVDVVHASSPCQGFSGANVFGGKNDKANNDLSLTFVEALRIFQPPVGVFENVSGMWKEKHLEYLCTILIRALALGYQVRCTLLWACSYGDCQKRPRLFIFAVKDYAPMVPMPVQTHGPPGSGCIPYVPVKAAVESLLHCSDDEYPNIKVCRKTSSKEGENKIEQLDPDGLAPAIRGMAPLLHYADGNRCVNVREAAAIMSIPYNYEFLGGMVEQYKQVGNGVPCELAAAVARTIKPVLKWVYKEEEVEKAENRAPKEAAENEVIDVDE